MRVDRRTVLTGEAAMQMIPGIAAAATSLARDEAHWAQIAGQYDVTRDVIQLENGNWGMMAKPVLAAYETAIARVNRDTSYYARRGMGADLRGVRARVAAFAGLRPDELVFTRNATEALKALIAGYNRLKPGDALLIADLDYDSMQAAMAARARQSGAELVRIALPEPATHQALIDAYSAAFDAHPRMRLALVTHVSHRTGLVLPVREIVALARARGIDVIVDAAHSWGQIDFTLAEIGADFIGVNLHKWIGAPLGVGAMVLRRDRLDAIDPDPGDEGDHGDSIDARIHTGTPDYAALLTVPAALDFQASIGGPAREARLRALRDHWAEGLRDLDGLQVLTPADPRLHVGITSFRVRGRTSVEDNIAVARALLDDHRIFAVHRAGVAAGACVRITPALFNSMADMEALRRALVPVVKRFATG